MEHLATALKEAGLVSRLRARDAGQVAPAAAYDPKRDTGTGLLNGPGIRDTAVALAESVAAVVGRREIPLVLAGDCSVILGGLLGLRNAARRTRQDPRPGLMFLDGHVDFYQPEASPTGEVADMDLALATGRGPDILARIDPSGALVREVDVAAVGARDAQERNGAGSQRVEGTGIHLFELATIRREGIESVARDAVSVVARPELASGFWLHLDADVLDDEVMPAVDYRQPGGLAPSELVTALKVARRSDRLSGLSVAIYNPALDRDGRVAEVLVDALSAGLLEE